MKNRLLALVLLAFAALPGHAAIVINEIMYHPSSELVTEEYIEIYNTGTAPVILTGWKFTNGVAFTFPNVSIAAGGYLVVAANQAAFMSKYPGVTNYVAGWIGQLSNSGNRIELDDNLGAKIDEVSYADDGDWAVRKKETVADYGHKGWFWDSAADGLGKSLELINDALDNSLGQNWGASTTANGTPGAANSIAAAGTAPFLLGVTQFPIVPTHNDQVAVTAQLVAATLTGVAVTVHYRNDGAASFTTLTMFDDGAHGDALPGDGVYGALLPVAANGTIVEYYVQAVDAASRTRTWPAPAFDDNLATNKTGPYCNSLYQVDDTVYAGAMPFYKMVMRAVDHTELTTINTTSAQAYSHAKMNATWITRDGTGTELRHQCGVRNRGHGSADLQPQGFNISFTNDRTWKSSVSLNLNSQYTYAQLFGSALFRLAGLSTPDSRQVQLRVNGTDPTGGTATAPAYGFYAANEVQDNDFANHHFPLDSSGNLYRGQRLDSNLQQADFTYIDANPASYQPVWFKHTNASENNWSDLIALCQTMSKGHQTSAATTLSSTMVNGSSTVTVTSTAALSVGAFVSGTNIASGTMILAIPSATTVTLTNPAIGASTNNVTYRLFSSTYDAGYEAEVTARVDVREWMRYFAVEALVDNSETSIYSGYGDDYYIYFGVTDPRCNLVPYDLDTICGQGDAVPSPVQHGLFRMTVNDDSASNGPSGIASFMQHPSFAPIYYDELKKQLDGAFVTADFNALADEILTGVVPPAEITSIKTFQAARTAHVATLVPLNLSVTTAPAVLNGYPHTTTATAKLEGKANAITTRSVTVNGVAATWIAWQAKWTAPSVALTPGINRVVIQAFDGSNVETERFTQDVWYDDATVASVSGAIAVNTVWTAAGGPYQVTANLTVNSGVTLTIQPGTSVYLASAVNIIVASGGRILAEGTDTQPIRFTRAPGAATSWGNLQLNGAAGSPETRIAYAHFEFNAGSPSILCTNATVYLDHLTFGNTAVSYIHLDGSSFIVSNCNFPTPTGNFEPVHGTGGVKAGGYGVIRDNYFGQPNLFNDAIDFTGGNRPSPVLQVIGNIFNGASDDCLDLDSTDAWIEGNVFMHVHRDPNRTDDARDTGSAISGGTDTASVYNEWTIINNVFYDVDHAVMTKQGGRVAFLHNTVSHVAKEAGAGTDIAAFNWTDNGLALPAASLGSGAYIAHNIIHDCPLLQANYNAANHTVIMDNNLLPVVWSGAGSGNQTVDPRLNLSVLAGVPVAAVTPAQVRQAFQLLTGSPAIGTGFGGRNIGGLGPHGIAIAGEPSGTTSSTSATLTVGLSGTINWGTIPVFPWGWTAYKWKLDGGAFSAEIPVTNNSPFTTPATISLSGLANGPHTVTVIGKSDVGYYQDDTLVYPATSGTPAATTVSKTWTVNTAYVPPPAIANVVINEVLAKNSETVNFGIAFPDIIELRNTGGATAVLDGWGLTDNTTLPYKYTFPVGSTLAAGAYLVIYADNSAAVPNPKTGFGLKQAGDTLTLTKSPGAGGTVADSVAFGAQLADYSIGRRLTDGGWDMCKPTFGTANVVAGQEKPARLLLNEWLADAQLLVSTDFIELYNPSALPVNIGACYLTNNPVENITVSPLRQLTFIAPGGYVFFKADSDPGQGPDHLAFKLSPQQGEIGFFDPAQNVIDRVIYGPQSTDVSQGRSPNGAATFAFFNQPTPGGPNLGTTGGGGGTGVVNLVPANQSWKYRSNGTDHSGDFFPIAFNDSAWVSGAQLLTIETAALTNTEGFVKTTVLPADAANPVPTLPYNTVYFRTHFNYSGALAGVTLTAKIMCDDGALIYLNGVEATRVRLPVGTIDYTSIATANVSDALVETISIPAASLVVGDNVLAVEVHQQHAAGALPAAQSSTDVVWGMKLDANVPVPGGTTAVVLNEVLANNATLTDPDGSLSGWVELYNTSASPVSLADMSLTNDTSDARKWVFPAGSTVPASGYLTVFCNPLLAASGTSVANMNTGFALGAAGDRVFLFQKPADGGGLQDFVNFGQQVPDRSIGRVTNGTGAFVLTTVTRGATNTAAALGAISTVKVNEWLALPPSGPGWFELFNTGASPVLLSGNYLTDILTNKTKYPVGPLTFIGGSGNLGNSRWLQLIADNDSGATPNHVNFTLNPPGEAIGLFSAAGVQLEAIAFIAQTLGISQGRLADGTATITSLNPTAGAANQPLTQDTDGDGIPDWWETLHGYNPNVAADAALDTDGDGQSNKAEYLAGTDPRNANDTLRAAITTTTPGQFHIAFIAQAGHAYTIQYKNLLTDALWTTLTQIGAPPSVPQAVDFTDTTVGANTRRFYHVVTPQVP